jgi:hypothetical protein
MAPVTLWPPCAPTSQRLVSGNQLRTGFLTLFVGTGQSYGRGFAVMTMMLGVLTIVFVLLVSRRRSLRHLNTNLPDVTAEDLVSEPRRGVGV